MDRSALKADWFMMEQTIMNIWKVKDYRVYPNQPFFGLTMLNYG